MLLLRASFKEAAAYQYADDLDSPLTVQDRLAPLLEDLLHGHDERQVTFLQQQLLLTVTDRFIKKVMNDHAALTQYGTLLIQHLHTDMHQRQISMTTQLETLSLSMHTVTTLLQQQLQTLEQALTAGVAELEERYRQLPPAHHLEGTNIAKDVVGTVIQTVNHYATISRPPSIAPVSRDTCTIAQAIIEGLPTKDIPEPVHQFAPGSRWHGRERNPDFVGREDELRQLAASLKTGTTAVIGPTAVAHGMGGIGKTDLVTEFAFRYGRFFAGGVFWLSFANPGQVDAEIAACGGADGLQLFLESDKLELADQVKRVIQAWSQPIPRLIICDTCEDQGLLHAYRKQIGPTCRMLVTSRDQTWKHPSYTRIGLNTLQRKQSILLLQRLCSRLSEDEADTIAEQLGDFPLALHLAGSYLNVYDHHTVAAYLEKLREVDILGHPSMQGRGADFSPTEHDLHVARTFALSFDRLDEDTLIDHLALFLLACAAQLAPGEPIPREFLLAMVPKEIDHDDAVDGLKRARAIGLIDGDTTLIMHRLVHQFVQGVLDAEDDGIQHRVWQVIIDSINVADDQGCVRTLLGLEPHLRSTITHTSQIETVERAHLLDRIARFFALQGRYLEAEPLSIQALTIKEQVLGLDHSHTANSLSNLASLYRAQGRYGQAEPLYLRALAILEAVLGPEHPEIATILHNLAYLYVDRGRYAEAEPLYLRALAIEEAVLGLNHPETASIVGALAGLYEKQGRYREAEPLLKRALSIHEAVLGPTHPHTATSMNYLAELYRTQGRYAEAEPLMERALAIYEAMLGSTHPHTATSMNNLALLYHAQGRYSKAEPLSVRALTIRKTTLGLNHPETASSIGTLAVLYEKQGRYEEAELLYQQSLAIVESVLGSDHSQTAMSLHTLALLYVTQERYEEAKPLLERALSIHETVFNTDHPSTANSLNNLAGLYMEQGQYRQAEPLFQRALTITEQVLGSHHPDTALSLNNLAVLYNAQGHVIDALPYAEQAYQIIRHIFGPAHPQTVLIYQNYKAIQHQIKQANSDPSDHNKAVPQLKRGMKGSDRNKPCPCGSGKKYKRCCGRG